MTLPFLSYPVAIALAVFLVVLATVWITLYASRTANVRNKKAIMRLAVVFGGLVSLYALFYVVMALVGGVWAASEVAALKKGGARLSVQEIIPPDVPAKDNAAGYYDAAFALMDVSGDFKKANDLFCFGAAIWSEADLKAARQALAGEDLRQILDLIRRGAEKPVWRFKRDYDKPLWKVLLPELNKCRAAARLLSAAAMVAAQDGDTRRAYQDIGVAFAMSTQMKGDSFLIGELVRVAMYSINMNCLVQLVRDRGLDTPQAQSLIGKLRMAELDSSMKRAMDGELVMTWEVFDKALSGDLDYGDLCGGSAGSALVNRAVAFNPLMRMDFAYYLSSVGKVRALFDKPYWDVAGEVEAKERIPSLYLVSRLMLPALKVIRTKTARADSEVDYTTLVLALEIYKNEHGAYPESLAQLCPGILPSSPPDPISGKPFSYSKKGVSYELSSVWLEEKRAREAKQGKPR